MVISELSLMVNPIHAAPFQRSTQIDPAIWGPPIWFHNAALAPAVPTSFNRVHPGSALPFQGELPPTQPWGSPFFRDALTCVENSNFSWLVDAPSKPGYLLHSNP
jgi:hypothetical protein